MNTILPAPNGPYMCGGAFVIVTASGERAASQATLCRCGGSANQPYCDSSHERLRFADAGRLPTGAPPGRAGPGTATLTPQAGGPLRVDGPVIIAASDGRTSTGDPLFLCRCGGSSTKPFCDGTHRRNGFTG
jgi:CDGSH-type Zn-finger protein